ncbi:MAG TPA: DUF2914 domain-containing protein [Geobacteraceae bacterium]
MHLFRHLPLAVIVFLLGSLAAVRAEAPRLKITELAVTTRIAKGNPIDSVHRISSAAVTSLYCFTRTEGSDDTDTFISHVWYRGEEKVGEYKLPVRGKKWRTFSKKGVERGWAGDWRVEVLDSEGQLLKTVRFRMN